MPKKNELVTQAEELAADVRAWLRELRRHHASGDLMKLDEAMGKKRGYCATLLRDPTPHEISTGVRRRLGVEEVFQLLLALGIDPREKFRGPFGFDLDLYLGRLERQKKHQVRTLEQRLTKTRRLEASLEELGRMAEEVERLRLTKPRRGKAQAFKVLATLAEWPGSEAKARVECEAWGALAGLQRLTATFSAAAYCLRKGLVVSRAWALNAPTARLLRRCCYLVADQGDIQEAVTCAEKARHLYAGELDFQGLAQTLIDSGIMLRRLGRRDAAIEALSRSLSLVPDMAWFDKLCALQTMGLAYADSGDHERASSCLDQLRETIPEDAPGDVIAASYVLEGEIALVNKDPELAEKCFRNVINILTKGSNLPQLVVMALRLSDILLRNGKLEEVQIVAKQMLSLPAQFSHNRLLYGCLNEFLAAVFSGELTTAVLRKLCAKMRGSASS